jgi:hypothetical protein
MVQAVSHRPLSAEARVRTQVSTYGFFGEQTGTGTGLSPSSSVSPVSIIPPWLSILTWGWTMAPFVAAVQRQSYPIDRNKALQ